VLLCLLVYVPGFLTIPVVDRDEARFAQASRQMLESVTLPADELELDPEHGRHRGGLAVPMVQGTPRLNKPPLIYWLQAGSAWVLTGGDPARDAIWMYRVPSLLASVVTVLITWRIGRSLFGDERVAMLGAALIAVSPVFVWEAHQARSDQVLVAFTTGAMACLWMTWRGARDGGKAGWLWPTLLWVCIALGVMTKGPITPMVVALSALSLSAATRRWAWLVRTRPLVGVVIVALAVGPWVYAVARQVGFENYLSLVFDETIGRAGGAKEGHWGPPGYHLVLLAVLLWPGSMLTAGAIVAAFRLALRRCRRKGGLASRLLSARATDNPLGRASLFCLGWIIPSWLVFELVSTKLPHYTMPLYPPIALLSAFAVVRAGSIVRRGPGAVGMMIWLGIGHAVLYGAHALVWASRPPAEIAAPGLVLVIACIAVGQGLLVLAGRAAIRGRLERAQIAAIGVPTALAISFLGVGLPANQAWWVSRRAAEAIRTVDATGERAVASVGYQEDSLIFETRGRAERIGAQYLGGWLAEHGSGLVLSPRDVHDKVALSYPTNQHAELTGFNYSKGDRVELVLWSLGAERRP